MMAIAKTPLDIQRIRSDFPILGTRVRGRPLVYLDNAATTQKPTVVIERLVEYYTHENANIHRGVHALSERATSAFEGARDTVRRFLNAASPHEIIFTRGATESINLVASSLGRQLLRPGDEVLITAMEHHSNIVPWQLICEATGAHLRVAPINDQGEVIWERFEEMLGPATRIVSVVHVSNSLGTVNPVRRMVQAGHSAGAVVLVDGAQAVSHMPVDVRDLGCDFYVFSGHKVFGPTGIGVLYGKEALLDAMPPYQGGGDMIRSVTFEKTLFNALPYKFEAGTPHIAGAIGLAAAIDYVEAIGRDNIAQYERDLLEYATHLLEEIPEVQIIGRAAHKAGVLSFIIDGVHPHDVGTILDDEGIAIRTGHHCTQPVMDRYGIPATARASFALYNTREEVDALAAGVRKVIEVFRR
jgi:cysteine desulfurase/selenocysteine lyase